ncbi:MAG: hypothetical protein JO173_01660, partial [Gammaproteobacteria bacterium]|nr:hypothetical protein [Gammaproteobacteria bacterium]
PYYRSRHGEESETAENVYALPVFGAREGRFTSHFSLTYIEAAQKVPGVKRLTPAQAEAIDLLMALAGELASHGADVLLAGATVAGTTTLPARSAHPVIEPLLFAQSFYRMATALALGRGADPDQPPHLRKVTETV